MPDRLPSGRRPVPASAYTREYYLTGCSGGEDFEATAGLAVSPVIEEVFDRFGVGPGTRCLDLGCGRGEVTFTLAKRGAHAVGVDYAGAALDLAGDMLRRHPDISSRVMLLRADAKHLPLPTGSIDRAFVLDLVEHLQSWELAEALAELRRVLRPDGAVFVHTMPNLRYYRWGYPVLRAAGRVLGRNSPRDPRSEYEVQMHVNEQTPAMLRRAMHRAGFDAELTVTGLEKSPLGPGPLDRVVRALSSRPPLRGVLGFHILVTARPL